MEPRDYIAIYAATVSTTVLIWDVVKFMRNRYRLELAAFGHKPYGYYLLGYQGEDWEEDTISVRFVALREATTLSEARVNFYPTRMARLLRRPVWVGSLVSYGDTGRHFKAERCPQTHETRFSHRLDKNDSIQIEIFVHAGFDKAVLPRGGDTPGVLEIEVMDAARSGAYRCCAVLPASPLAPVTDRRSLMRRVYDALAAHLHAQEKARHHKAIKEYLAQRAEWERLQETKRGPG